MSKSLTYEVWVENIDGTWSRVTNGDDQVFDDKEFAKQLALPFMAKNHLRRAIVIERRMCAEFNCAGRSRPVPLEEQQKESSGVFKPVKIGTPGSKPEEPAPKDAVSP